jgi:hypothetical protein
MSINVIEWNRRRRIERRENIFMSGGGSPDITDKYVLIFH